MSAASKTVLIAGATGYIGRNVVDELLDRGYRVVALVRAKPDAATAEYLKNCDVRVGSVTNSQELEETLSGLEVDAVVSCIASRSGEPSDAWLVDYEANRKLLNAARRLGAARFVLLSAICVQKPELEFQKAKLAFEAELAESGMDYAIVRPTAFFKSISGQVERVRSGKPFLVFGTGTETRCKPVSERDLARYLVNCIERDEYRNRILPIGGPGDALTPLDQGALLFELLGTTPRYRHVPVRLFDVAIAVLRPLSKLFPALAGKAEFARIGRYYATESMLVWDAENDRYDASATPETGSDSLRSHYQRMLSDGDEGQELGAHKLF